MVTHPPNTKCLVTNLFSCNFRQTVVIRMRKRVQIHGRHAKVEKITIQAI